MLPACFAGIFSGSPHNEPMGQLTFVSPFDENTAAQLGQITQLRSQQIIINHKNKSQHLVSAPIYYIRHLALRALPYSLPTRALVDRFLLLLGKEGSLRLRERFPIPGSISIVVILCVQKPNGLARGQYSYTYFQSQGFLTVEKGLKYIFFLFQNQVGKSQVICECALG